MLVFLPMYTYFLNMPPVTGDALFAMLYFGILPFNLLKGALLMALTILLFSRMKSWIEKQRVNLLAE